MEGKKNDQEILSEIEKMLSINITDVGSYIFDTESNTKYPVKKNYNQLLNERLQIKNKLHELYRQGEMNLFTLADMKMAIDRKYEAMMSKAIKPIVNKSTQTSTTVSTDSELSEEKIMSDDKKPKQTSKFRPLTDNTMHKEVDQRNEDYLKRRQLEIELERKRKMQEEELEEDDEMHL